MIKLKLLLKEGYPPVGIYGHWITPSGNMLPINQGVSSHEKFAIELLQQLVKSGAVSQQEYDALNIPFNSSTAVDRLLMSRGYIRGVQDGPDQYYANGRGSSQQMTHSQQKALEKYGRMHDVTVEYLTKGEGSWHDKIVVYSPHNKMNELEYPLATDKDLQSYEGMVGWKGKLVWMSPDKFLRLCYPLPDYEKNDISSQNLRNRMLKGLPIDFLVLTIDVNKKKVVGHEGRHRATIAKELGIKQVPVLIYTGSNFKRVPQWSPEDHEMADKADFHPEWDKLHEGHFLITIDKQLEELEKMFAYYDKNEHSIPDAIKRKMEIADEIKNLNNLKQLLNTPQQ